MADEESVDRYACKQCRRVLFTSKDLMGHTPEQHSLPTRRLIKDAKTKQLKSGLIFMDGCSSWFLEDTLPWMDEDSLNEGKLKCPNEKCQTRVGSFDWAGSQCSCGTWVTPSIKITKSRVDLLLTANAIPIVSTIMNVPTYKAAEEEMKTQDTVDIPPVKPAASAVVSVDDLDLED